MRRSLSLCKKRKTENNPQSPASSTEGNSEDVVTSDILMEVLNRLPAKSVGRFLLVSKSWAQIICSKCFIRWFPSRSLTQPLRLLMAITNQDRKTGHRSCRFFSSSSLSSSSSSTSVTPTSFLSRITWTPRKYPRAEYPSYYVNGLMCVGETICNPCTGKSITLPSVTTRKSTRVARFFGYDPVNDEYKVLRITKTLKSYMLDPWSDFQVFTLGDKQESWREIDCSVPHHPYSRGLCIDGAVYYIARTGTGYSLLRFDLKSEKFDIYARVSEDLRDWNDTVPTILINYNGKVAALIQPERYEHTIELFVFEAGKQDFYERSFHNIPYPSLQMKGINQTSEIIFAPRSYEGVATVILYDLKGGSFKTIKTEVDVNLKWDSEAIYFFGRYVESLMLL